MATSRTKKAKLNIIVSLLCQIVHVICGFIVPRMMLGAFGSELYGATSSITHFLAYITLLEGGIGGVARASLYKPLADMDYEKMSATVNEVKHFFRMIAYAFIVYVFIIAGSFKYISDIKCFDWLTSFVLVWVISISTFGQYFIGISNSILLQADQKTYVNKFINIVSTVLNTILIIVFIKMGCNIIIVKLVSSCVFLLRPVAMWAYVKKNYPLVPTKKREKGALKDKWSGLGQHIAYTLHSNTDVTVLTIFANLSLVAVYSIYYTVVSHIQSITSSFVTGMEAVFGDMLAKKEMDKLSKTFSYYETLISFISIVMFSTTAVLIVPFVRIYTNNVNDVNYIAPTFGLLLTISSLLYCLRSPYHSMIIAAGHFKQTRTGAYGEAIINIVLSITLVIKFNLIGVAIGTIAATTFRLIYYVVYLSKNIFFRDISLFIKRELVNTGSFVAVLFVGSKVISSVTMDTYAQWAIYGLITVLISTVLTAIFCALFYYEDCKVIVKKIKK